MRYCLWNHMTIWTSTFPHVPNGSFLQEICSKKNSGLTRITGYGKYVVRCFALVSTCCPVSLYLHTYLVHYLTGVCMIACLSILFAPNYLICINGYISVEYIQCQWIFLALHCSCKYMLSFISVLILTGSCSCTITLQLIFLCPPFSTHQIYIYSYHKVGTEEV